MNQIDEKMVKKLLELFYKALKLLEKALVVAMANRDFDFIAEVSEFIAEYREFANDSNLK